MMPTERGRMGWSLLGLISGGIAIGVGAAKPRWLGRTAAPTFFAGLLLTGVSGIIFLRLAAGACGFFVGVATVVVLAYVLAWRHADGSRDDAVTLAQRQRVTRMRSQLTDDDWLILKTLCEATATCGELSTILEGPLGLDRLSAGIDHLRELGIVTFSGRCLGHIDCAVRPDGPNRAAFQLTDREAPRVRVMVTPLETHIFRLHRLLAEGEDLAKKGEIAASAGYTPPRLMNKAGSWAHMVAAALFPWQDYEYPLYDVVVKQGEDDCLDFTKTLDYLQSELKTIGDILIAPDVALLKQLSAEGIRMQAGLRAETHSAHDSSESVSGGALAWRGKVFRALLPWPEQQKSLPPVWAKDGAHDLTDAVDYVSSFIEALEGCAS
jgi:hypothetical protein